MNKKVKLPYLLLLAAIPLLLMFFRTDYGIVAFKRLSIFNSFIVDGKNNWLFYRGDLDYVLLPWNSAAKKLAAIDSIAKQNNVTLIIVPVPNKIDLYPEYLDKRISNDFPYLKNKTAGFMKRLENCAVLNLYDRYRNARDTMRIFDPDENHATSYGIKIAVEETMHKFFPHQADSRDSCLQYKQIEFIGDLAEKKYRNPTKRVINICYNSCRSTTPASDTVLIFGDSYCYYLKQYLGSYGDLLESRLGGRYFFQMYSHVDAGFKLSNKILSLINKKPRHKIIIWLFTAREFYKPLKINFLN